MCNTCSRHLALQQPCTEAVGRMPGEEDVRPKGQIFAVKPCPRTSPITEIQVMKELQGGKCQLCVRENADGSFFSFFLVLLVSVSSLIINLCLRRCVKRQSIPKAVELEI